MGKHGLAAPKPFLDIPNSVHCNVTAADELEIPLEGDIELFART